MSSGINTSYTPQVITPSTESDFSGTERTQSTQSSQAAAPTQEEVGIVMAAMQKLMGAASPSLGVNAYGSVASDGGSRSLGLGRVLTPASTQEAPEPGALSNVTNLMASYGQSSLGGAGGVVGNSLVHAAESGNLPDLSGYGAATGSNSTASTPTPSSKSNDKTAFSASSPSAASTASTATVDGVSVISNTEVKSATLESGDFAKAIDNSASDQGTKKCHKLKNGEEDNAKRLQSIGITNIKDANNLAVLLNSTNNEKGTSGAAKTNIINLMAVLEKLNASGQGKSEASTQVKAELKKLGDMSVSGKDATISKDFIFETNKAASYVAQYGLNPELTSFTEPTLGTKPPGVPWPDQAPGVEDMDRLSDPDYDPYATTSSDSTSSGVSAGGTGL